MIEVTVPDVVMDLSLSTQVFLPSDASDVLKAHERGHVKICSEIYRLIAEKEAKAALGAFPASFKIAKVSPCEQEEIQKRINRSLAALFNGFCSEVSNQVFQTMDGVGEKYDIATANGTRNGPTEDEATVGGQGEATQEAIDGFNEENDEDD